MFFNFHPNIVSMISTPSYKMTCVLFQYKPGSLWRTPVKASEPSEASASNICKHLHVVLPRILISMLITRGLELILILLNGTRGSNNCSGFVKLLFINKVGRGRRYNNNMMLQLKCHSSACNITVVEGPITFFIVDFSWRCVNASKLSVWNHEEWIKRCLRLQYFKLL